MGAKAAEGRLSAHISVGLREVLGRVETFSSTERGGWAVADPGNFLWGAD